MAKRRRRKKNKKFFKKLFILILIIGLFLIGTFFFDRKTFYTLKDNIILEITKITNKIEKSLGIIRKEKYDNIDFDDDLTVLFLDVGQADSILIKSQDEYMLIDAGNNNDGDKLVSYFNYLGIKNFKYVVGTHAHEDHIGGLDSVIKQFNIENFYMPNTATTTQTFLDVLNALEKKKIALKTPEVGTKLKLGNSEIEVLSVKNKAEELNDTSIVLRLVYKNVSFLFTGDATSNVEKEILNKNITSTVLKVGHHGSKYSNSAAFIKKVNPKYAVISCGLNNEYYHPHQVVLDKFNALNTQIFRTDQLGTIVLTSDGFNVNYKAIKTYTDGG